MPKESIKLGAKISYKLLGFGVGGLGFLVTIAFAIVGFYLGWNEKKPEFLYIFFSCLFTSFFIVVFGSLMQFLKKERRNKRLHEEIMSKLDKGDEKDEIAKSV